MVSSRKGSNQNSDQEIPEAIPNVEEVSQETALERVISKAQFAELGSFEDALALMQEAYGVVSRSDEFGDGFEILEDKRKLVGVPFCILDTSIAESKEIFRDGKPALFAVLRVMDQNNRKWVLTDGSTGICSQIQEWRSKTGRRGGFVAAKGLRVSDYDYTDNDGNTTKASTFYLDESGV